MNINQLKKSILNMIINNLEKAFQKLNILKAEFQRLTIRCL